tara:strand:+ start:1427 stop:2017 length:591 start_codon:yes stop_codon:yes gene_type:complete
MKFAAFCAALLFDAGASGMLVGVHYSRPARAAAERSGASSVAMAGNFLDAIAQDPLGMLKNNLMQMQDQRVAQISHIMLRTDPAALNVRTKGECYELLSTWKETIADDAERFAQCARERSECASKSRDGDLGFLSRAKMSKQFCEIAFVEEPGRVYGPVETDKGMHLLYLISCRGDDDFKKEKKEAAEKEAAEKEA